MTKTKLSILEIAAAGLFLIVFVANGIKSLPPAPPVSGIVLPVEWGYLGKQLADSGVIDLKKFPEALSFDGKPLIITKQNSARILNLLWAFGLGNKNDILEKGPMVKYGTGAIKNFASTGGWTLGKGNAMDHYSKHQFIILTPEQQQLVAEVSKNVYRPCCRNPAYFPDCNHGMAMLGLLELMALHGASEQEMYRTALQVNSYWFPSAGSSCNA